MKNGDPLLNQTYNLTDHEKNDIICQIDKMIERHQSDSRTMTLRAMEAVSLAAAVESRSDEIEHQNILCRHWRSLTGKNQKISARNKKDMAKAMYLSHQIISVLAERNLIPLKLVSVLDEKIKVISGNLSENSLRLKGICDVFSKFIDKFKDIRSEVSGIKRDQKFQRWAETVSYDEDVILGKKYGQLKRREKIICIVSDFYRYSEGSWRPKDILLLKKALGDIGMNPEDEFAPIELIKMMGKSEDLLSRFIPDGDCSQLDIDITLTPYLTGLYKQHLLNTEEKHLAEKLKKEHPSSDMEEARVGEIQKYVRQLTNKNLERPVKVIDLILEMANDLSIYHLVSGETAEAMETTDDAEPSQAGEDAEGGVGQETFPLVVKEQPPTFFIDENVKNPLDKQFVQLVKEDQEVTEKMLNAIDDI